MGPISPHSRISSSFPDSCLSLTSSYYRGAQGVILVYDVSLRSTFDHLPTWFSELDTYASSSDVIKILVGNKTDKGEEKREVTRKEGEQFAKKMGALFIEASAKTKNGVQEAFGEVVRKVGLLDCQAGTFLTIFFFSFCLQIVETPDLWRKTKPATSGVDLGGEEEREESGCAC